MGLGPRLVRCLAPVCAYNYYASLQVAHHEWHDLFSSSIRLGSRHVYAVQIDLVFFTTIANYVMSLRPGIPVPGTGVVPRSRDRP